MRQAKDETRLMKRKEQNRAAQRAFRERKEKHVKDVCLIVRIIISYTHDMFSLKTRSLSWKRRTKRRSMRMRTYGIS